MLARTKSVVGLDIGSSAVKAVELAFSGDEVELTGFGQVEVPPDNPAAKSQAVKDLLSSGGFRSKRIVTSVSGKEVVVRYLNMARMSQEELKNTISFEAEKYVPFPIEECVVDCQKLEGEDETKKGSNMPVLMVAVKRSQIADHLKILSDAGVVPEAIDVDSFAIANIMDLCRGTNAASSPDEAVLAFVDIGLAKTSVNITDRGTTLFTREITMAGQDFTSAIARGLNLGADEAETRKRREGSESQEVRTAVFSALEDLGNEIQLSLDYFQNQHQKPVGRVILSGGGARLAAAQEAFERIFEKSVTVFNPFASFRVSEGIDQDLLACTAPQLVVAAGLAARGQRG
jgi:type IV pilus assembly protein PilM